MAEIGRPHKNKGNEGFEDFLTFYNIQMHDWNAANRMNKYVNAALGVDMFSAMPWPCRLIYTETHIRLDVNDTTYNYLMDEFNYDAAVSAVKEAINVSEYS